jgi:hypothetical protein
MVDRENDLVKASYLRLIQNEALKTTLEVIGADSFNDEEVKFLMKTLQGECGLNYGSSRLAKMLGLKMGIVKLSLKSAQNAIQGQDWTTITGGDPQLEEGQHWHGLSHPQNRQDS